MTVKGLREFRTALKAIDAEAPKALTKIHKTLADKAAAWSREKASAGSPMQRAAAAAIKGSGTQASAAVAVSNARIGFADAAFWGAKRHAGWYADPRYTESTGRQFPLWVGNDWDTGVAGQGPYAINAALAEHMGELLDEYGNLVDDLTRYAFPDRRF